VDVAAPSNEDLNRLYAASLEFGANWRRPVPELAALHLTHLAEREQRAISSTVSQSRQEVEARIEATHVTINGSWTAQHVDDLEQWISERFPWMNADNRRHAISQGRYYAWHDHG
jgi:hypothetical protein